MTRGASPAGTPLPFRVELIQHASFYLLRESEAAAPARRFGSSQASLPNKVVEQRGEEQRGKKLTALR